MPFQKLVQLVEILEVRAHARCPLGGGWGGARGVSERCGALDVALRALALSCRGLGAGAGCRLLL